MGQAKKRKKQRTQSNENFSMLAMQTYLAVEDQLDATYRLLGTASNWQKSYLPIPRYANQIKAIKISCIGEIALLEIVPLTDTASN